MKRLVSLVILIVGLLFAGFPGRAMAQTIVTDQSTVSVTVPTMVQIEGLVDISLTGPFPGTVTGSGVFTVTTNAPNGATVVGEVSAFSPSLANTASVDAMVPVPQSVTTTRTAIVSLDIDVTDLSGLREAILTITVTTL